MPEAASSATCCSDTVRPPLRPRPTSARARGLARQADLHAGDVTQARRDIPPPQEFDELNQQLRQTWQANQATGGKYAPALAALNARKADLNTSRASPHPEVMGGRFAFGGSGRWDETLVDSVDRVYEPLEAVGRPAGRPTDRSPL